MFKLRSCFFNVFSILLVAVLVGGCAASKSRLKIGQTSEGEVVEAEGMVPNITGDLIGTKRAALVEAQKNAVEKTVGVYVSGKTMVEKAIAIENNILARTDGYIKKYDILDEKVEGEFFVTKIRALVAIKNLEADLKSYSLLSQPELRRPRVTILLEEKIDGDKIDEDVALAALRQSLIDQGFIVLNDASKNEAEISIKGSVASLPFQSEGLGGFVSYRARMSIQALRGRTDEVVTSYSNEASGLGGNKTLAGFKSLEVVAQLVGEEIGKKLTNLWSKGGNCLVMVEKVPTFSDVERVRKHLQSQPVVKDLMLRFYDENAAQFELQIGTTRPEELAASLEQSRSLPLKVLESSNGMIRLELTATP